MGCDIHAMIECKDEYGFWNNCGDPCIGRDYELFAVLAGVRNDGYGVKPIAELRGVDEGSCGPFRAWVERWDADAHSASWVTLAEMKAYDLEQEINDSHLVLRRDEAGRITRTCAATTGKHLGEVGKRKVFGIWGRDHWDSIIVELESVKTKHKIESDQDVRLVFFFDN